jgi:ribosomal-protein-alanine N-acetyltransferase
MDASHLEAVVALESLASANPWTADSFLHELEENVFSRPWVVLTSQSPQTVVGYCVSWIVFDEIHVQNLAVHPLHRRLGLARHLLEHALTDGRRSGADKAQLEVRCSNHPAMKLYESLGFRIVGERKDYYTRPREDAIVLLKELT